MTPRPLITISVEGIGDFAFRRRTIADEVQIMARYDAMIGTVSPSPFLDTIGAALATYRVLVHTHPIGWEPDKIAEMDVLESDGLGDLLRVHGAFSAREDEFRPPARRRFQAIGESPGQQPGDVVPPPLQPAAD